MRGSDDFYFLRFEHRPLTPEQLDRLRRSAERSAKDYRTRLLRSLGLGLMASLRSAARGGRDIVRALGDRVAAAASRRRRAYAAWRQRRAAVNELAALDDRTLKDLGLHRSEIESVVYGRETARARPGQTTALRQSTGRATAGTHFTRRQAPSIEKSAA
jgi:uncharacterized protein YjiS (DUF1127 family)